MLVVLVLVLVGRPVVQRPWVVVPVQVGDAPVVQRPWLVVPVTSDFTSQGSSCSYGRAPGDFHTIVEFFNRRFPTAGFTQSNAMRRLPLRVVR